MKKKLLIILILFTIILVFGCSNKVDKQQTHKYWASPNKQLDQSNPDKVISDYIFFHNTVVCDKAFEAHKIYGLDKTGNHIHAYVEYYVDSYEFKDGFFQIKSGGGGYALIELNKNNNKYEVVSFKEVMVTKCVNEIFPKEYAERALKEVDSGELRKEVNRQADEWLQVQGRMEKRN